MTFISFLWGENFWGGGVNFSSPPCRPDKSDKSYTNLGSYFSINNWPKLESRLVHDDIALILGISHEKWHV